MKKFLIRISASFLLFIGVLWVVVFLTGFFVWGSRVQSIKLKEGRLESLKNSRKVIVIGGSGADYGIDCSVIEKRIGLPAVNLAIQASLGISFILNEARTGITQHDVVIFHVEPALLTRIAPQGEATLLQLISRWPKAIRYADGIPWSKSPKYIGNTIRSNIMDAGISLAYRVTAKKTNVDLRSPQGDYIGHQNKKPTYVSEGQIQYDSVISQQVLDKISSFVEYCETRGTEVFFVFAPTDSATIHREVLAMYQKQLEGIANLVVLSQPEMSVMPTSYFFDTAHHLKFEKRAEWTESIMDRIKI